MGAVSDYLRSQRVTSLPDLQVSFFLLPLGFMCDSCFPPVIITEGEV